MTEINDTIVTDNGDGVVLAYERGNSINLYLVDFGDHLDVVAQDNATNWVVGSRDDKDLNYQQIMTIGIDRLAEFNDTVVKIEDEGLCDFINERINDANMMMSLIGAATSR